MSRFLRLIGYEYQMSLRRKGLWIGYALVFCFFTAALVYEGADEMFVTSDAWAEAGALVFMFNMLMPLVGGIMAADRLQRDQRLGVYELQRSTPLPRGAYLSAKYLGVLLSALTPTLLSVVSLAVFAVVNGLFGVDFVGIVIVAFLAISVPSFAFVVAFSLACPLAMPLRVYQILFTGYWFWGNYLNHEVFPTVSGTLLNSCGSYAQEGLFHSDMSIAVSAPQHAALDAVLNIAVLLACAGVALLAANTYLGWKARQA